jgi:hypothetical protein
VFDNLHEQYTNAIQGNNFFVVLVLVLVLLNSSSKTVTMMRSLFCIDINLVPEFDRVQSKRRMGEQETAALVSVHGPDCKLRELR